MRPADELAFRAVAFAVLAAALFGSALVTTHTGLRHIDAASGARVSIPTATLLFWLSSSLLDWSAWHWAAAGIFALVGLFFPAAVTLLTFEANRRLGPTTAGTIGSTSPLFAVLGAALFLGEALGARELIATAAIVLGSIALSSRGAGRGGRAPAGALWLPWSAAILRALAQVLSKAGLALWSSPFAAALLGYTVSTAAIWSASALPGYPRLAVNRRGVSWFALTGILNGGAVLALYKALSTGPVWLVSPIVSIYPLFTLALSVVILRHEPLTRRLAGGVVLTVGGVILLLAGGRT